MHTLIKLCFVTYNKHIYRIFAQKCPLKRGIVRQGVQFILKYSIIYNKLTTPESAADCPPENTIMNSGIHYSCL